MECCKNSMVKNSKLYRTVELFKSDIKLIKNNPRILETFYSYLSMKYNIKCEIGMLFIERLIFKDLYERITQPIKKDMLFSKILFYEWIKPCHLRISLCEEDLKNSLKLFQKSFSRPSVTEMISSFMDTMYYIYKSIGRESDHDVFFPTLTYLLIKSKRSDLEIFHTFITKYKRNKYPGCSLNCKHNQNLVCSCNAFKTYDDSEVSYYLVVYKASLEFITRMEFYDLNISVEEFNNLITKSSQNK